VGDCRSQLPQKATAEINQSLGPPSAFLRNVQVITTGLFFAEFLFKNLKIKYLRLEVMMF
jgi:hypothetical protein